MPYVITQNCCKDASCVPVCPVDCIRPGDGADVSTEMLYIDPETCIDCGACLDECPVDAIHYDEDLPPELERFRGINAAYFERHPLQPSITVQPTRRDPVQPGSLRVAIVGAGPAACYAAVALTNVDGVQVDVFDRLPTPFGLIRGGVAPDHQHTKSVVRVFEHALAHKRVNCHLNVEIGRDLTHAELVDHHHAVIYAVGAAHGRLLDIPGEDLVGNHSAVDFVGWYNGHPDHANHVFDLSGERAVIVGNGNVALDAARVLLLEPDVLASTDIATHALNALSHSNIREVTILGRRGPRDAAFSAAEFLALGHLTGVDVVIDGDDLDLATAANDDVETALKLQIAREYASRPAVPGNKRIVFRFHAYPAEVTGSDRATGLRVAANVPDTAGVLVGGGVPSEILDASLILRAIGYRGTPIEGLPFASGTGTIPHLRGKVLEADGDPLPGVYVTGWIKRGPRGVIGTNRACAEETVAELLDDYAAGLLGRRVSNHDGIDALLSQRGVQRVDWDGWKAVDIAERRSGSAESRPRVKFVDLADMLAAAAT